MFVAAFFTIAKRRKQAKAPLLGEQTKNYHADNPAFQEKEIVVYYNIDEP